MDRTMRRARGVSRRGFLKMGGLAGAAVLGGGLVAGCGGGEENSGGAVEIVGSGTVLPAGVTRFRVRERVLGVRYPLDRMMEGEPRARNVELRRFVSECWAENRVRYYREPVVLFE